MCVIFYYKAKACNHFVGTRAANCGRVADGEEVYCADRENQDAISAESHCPKCIMALMVQS
jgi:hypothetical protein